MSEYVIEAVNMTRKFADFTAVDKLNLKVQKGIIYGFLGPNGCGKSTSFRMLTGLLSPTEGEVTVLGYSLPKEADKLRMKIGYMTQKFSLYENLTVFENLNFVRQIYGVKKSRIDELFSIYRLEQLKDQLVGSMSGGQKQRLALAAAVIHKPELLFLDEPTSAVDPESRRDFWEQLFDLSDAGTTIIVSTHYMDEAERCHKLAILENGVKQADGSPQELISNMGVSVFEIEGDDLRTLKSKLSALKNIVSAAQLGSRLRVIV